TGPAAAARNVERDRNEVADLKIFDVTALLDHFASDLVSEHHAGRRRRATPHHVLVGAADIRRDDLENDAVIDRLSCRVAEGRKVDLLNFDAARFEVNNAAVGVGSHLRSPLGFTRTSFQRAEFPWTIGSGSAIGALSDRPNDSVSMDGP